SIYRSQTQQMVMTPPEFQTYVDWPGVRPTFAGGGDGAGTSAGAEAEQAASDASMGDGDGNDDIVSD
ncbi:hypothetical protein A2U01_0081849, partial [Trifolium medium]|nr:hypothetical protein [Trifolium medium]